MFEVKGLPKDKEPIVYLSGFISKKKGLGPEEETKILVEKGKVKYRCYSHAFVSKEGVHYSKHIEETMHENLKLGVRVMMDSGAFSFHQVVRQMARVNKKGWTKEEFAKFRDQTIESYVEFCRKYSKSFDFLINYDWKLHSPTIYKMQKHLEKLGMRPVPVFHGDETIDWLLRYCKEGHKLICVGGGRSLAGRDSWKGKRAYYDAVFNVAERYGVKLHGLAQTSMHALFQWPWAAVDSATWAVSATYGCILNVNENTGVMSRVHVSTTNSNVAESYMRMSKHVQKSMQEQVEREGFDFQLVRESGFWRGVYNARMYSTKVMGLKEHLKKERTEWVSFL